VHLHAKQITQLMLVLSHLLFKRLHTALLQTTRNTDHLSHAELAKIIESSPVNKNLHLLKNSSHAISSHV